MTPTDKQSVRNDTFLIYQAMGLSEKEYCVICSEINAIEQSENITNVEIVNAVVANRNPHDVMAGFKLATLLYRDAGRLKQ